MRYNIIVQLLSLCAGLALTTSAFAESFVFFNVSGATATYPAAMNSAGDVAGIWFDSSGTTHGFLRLANGSFTTFDTPAGVYLVKAIDDNDDICGVELNQQGFLRTSGGTVTEFAGTPSGINDSGTIAGFIVDSGVQHGFVRSSDGQVTEFDAPGATSTTGAAINANGDVTGFYAMTGNNTYPFLRYRNGTYAAIRIDFPSGETGAINAAGQIAGKVNYVYSQEVEDYVVAAGYIWFNGRETIFDCPNSLDTGLSGINNSGNTAGVCRMTPLDKQGHGFLRTSDGVITTFKPTPGEGTVVTGVAIVGINDSNVIVGVVQGVGSAASQGFLRFP